MMELLPPVGWADVARQRDVDALREHMDVRFDAIERRWDERFGSLEQRWDERFGSLEQRSDQRFDSLDQRFATKDDLRDQTDRFIGWMVASNATLVATVTLITALR